MSPTHISVIERGVKSPKPETLIRIANILHVSSDALLQGVVTCSSDGLAPELSAAIAVLPTREKERILQEALIKSARPAVQPQMIYSEFPSDCPHIDKMILEASSGSHFFSFLTIRLQYRVSSIGGTYQSSGEQKVFSFPTVPSNEQE